MTRATQIRVARSGTSARRPAARRPIMRPSSFVPSRHAAQCRKKFLRFFRRGFQDQMYLDWERGYKWRAHTEWNEYLGQPTFGRLLRNGQFTEIASRAVRI